MKNDNFTLQDLKSGMIVETQCMGFYLVLGNRFLSDKGYNEFKDYNRDLTNKYHLPYFDIIAVYTISPDCVIRNTCEIFTDIKRYASCLNIIWKRSEPQEVVIPMTLDEIENKLGHKIKIIDKE